MEVLKNRVYRHFKGNYYIVLDIGFYTETNEKCVIYRALYEKGDIYIRPYTMFVSKVDKQKYPKASQMYRFELVNIPSITSNVK